MIIYHPDRLHVSVTDGTADESETSLLEVLTKDVRCSSTGWYLTDAAPTVLKWDAADKAPLVGGEGAKLLLHF